VDGKAFLQFGDDIRYWIRECHLPFGPSFELVHLVQAITHTRKEKSRGNASHLVRDAQANILTVVSPSPPVKWGCQRLKFLHGLLWGKEDSLRGTVFCDFQGPSGNHDTWTAVKLSLSGIPSAAQLLDAGCLPCGADELLVRNAYREMYDILLDAQARRLQWIQKSNPLSDRQKIIQILGQPSIGKTWFLSYVLVRRLLEGKPTIFQVADNFRGDNGFADATHYLIDADGVRRMDKRPPFFELINPDIWVLAAQMPVGAPRRVREHRWLVVVTSEPREADFKDLVKDHSPQQYYLPTWDWGEIMAAA